jgi:NAD-dependent deacetylase
MIETIAQLLKNATNAWAFTGAGISIASGIPPFRGDHGLWAKYDMKWLELQHFLHHPDKSWAFMRDTFYEYYNHIKPNPAHYALGELEGKGLIKGVITQNIDNLHQAGGSKNVWEYHGNLKHLVCWQCGRREPFRQEVLEDIPPLCSHCGHPLKPDIVFFSEQIPAQVVEFVNSEIEKIDVLLVVGTSAEIFPAGLIPDTVHRNGGIVIDVNPNDNNMQFFSRFYPVREKSEVYLPALAKAFT